MTSDRGPPHDHDAEPAPAPRWLYDHARLHDEESNENRVALERFARSREFSDAGRPGAPRWAGLMLDMGWYSAGLGAGALTPAEVWRLVFCAVPREVLLTPRDAAPLLLELRAFWAFAARALHLANARACAAELERPDACAELARRLGDARAFGPIKRLYLECQEAGREPTDDEVDEVWDRELEAAAREPLSTGPRT